MKKLLIFILSTVLISCSGSDDDATTLLNSYLKADINGETKTFNVGPNSVAAAISGSSVGSDMIYVFGLGATTDGISDNSETTSLSMVLLIENPDVIVAGASFNSSDDGLSAGYFYNLENEDPSIDADETLTANLSISAIDLEDERISGSFSFSVRDPNTNETYTVSNGIFNAIPFVPN